MCRFCRLVWALHVCDHTSMNESKLSDPGGIMRWAFAIGSAAGACVGLRWRLPGGVTHPPLTAPAACTPAGSGATFAAAGASLVIVGALLDAVSLAVCAFFDAGGASLAVGALLEAAAPAAGGAMPAAGGAVPAAGGGAPAASGFAAAAAGGAPSYTSSVLSTAPDRLVSTLDRHCYCSPLPVQAP